MKVNKGPLLRFYLISCLISCLLQEAGYSFGTYALIAVAFYITYPEEIVSK